MEQATRFVGMDVHKDTIVVAVTATGEAGKAAVYGTIPNTTVALEKLVARLRQAGGGPLKFCYEAGPCGYGVHRSLTKLGEDCMVVAPMPPLPPVTLWRIYRMQSNRAYTGFNENEGIRCVKKERSCSMLCVR